MKSTFYDEIVLDDIVSTFILHAFRYLIVLKINILYDFKNEKHIIYLFNQSRKSIVIWYISKYKKNFNILTLKFKYAFTDYFKKI